MKYACTQARGTLLAEGEGGRWSFGRVVLIFLHRCPTVVSKIELGGSDYVLEWVLSFQKYLSGGCPNTKQDIPVIMY